MTELIECVDCHAMFEFAKGEQRFFAGRGLRERPRRCAACRDARKRRFVDSDDPAQRRRAPRVEPALPAALAPATTAVACACCGLDAEIDFVPAMGRPVYCEQCYNFRQKDGVGWRG